MPLLPQTVSGRIMTTPCNCRPELCIEDGAPDAERGNAIKEPFAPSDEGAQETLIELYLMVRCVTRVVKCTWGIGCLCLTRQIPA